MTDEGIDKAILLVVGQQQGSRRVAMVVVKVQELLAMPLDRVGAEAIANRIKALAGERVIVGNGDLNEWRHSEVAPLEKETPP